MKTIMLAAAITLTAVAAQAEIICTNHGGCVTETNRRIILERRRRSQRPDVEDRWKNSYRRRQREGVKVRRLRSIQAQN